MQKKVVHVSDSLSCTPDPTINSESRLNDQSDENN